MSAHAFMVADLIEKADPTTEYIKPHVTATGPCAQPESEASPLQAFGQMVRFSRRKRALSLEDLASMCSLERGEMEAIEAGRATLERVIQSLPAVARALGASPRTLSRVLLRLGLGD